MLLNVHISTGSMIQNESPSHIFQDSGFDCNDCVRAVPVLAFALKWRA